MGIKKADLDTFLSWCEESGISDRQYQKLSTYLQRRYYNSVPVRKGYIFYSYSQNVSYVIVGERAEQAAELYKVIIEERNDKDDAWYKLKECFDEYLKKHDMLFCEVSGRDVEDVVDGEGNVYRVKIVENYWFDYA